MEKHKLKPSGLPFFERIRIINLRHREDRRKQVRNELARIGVSIDNKHASFFEAQKFDDQGEFPSIGARGCFDSHLKILEEAARERAASVLILEDDFQLTRHGRKNLKAVLDRLEVVDWSIFYGGGRVQMVEQEASLVTSLNSTQVVQCAHFIAFKGKSIDAVVAYLNAILERCAGSPEGGPMHVDGAYSWFRQAHPEFRTFMALPEIAVQRPSISDITPSSRRIEKIPLVSVGIGLARALKSRLM